MLDLLRQFQEDPTVIFAGILVALDVLLGISAALKRGTFKFVIIGDFMRSDVLGKLIPYYGVWIAVHVGGDLVVAVGGHELALIEEAAGAFIIIQLLASIANSLRDLGFPGVRTAPDVVAADDPTTPG